ncbi:MAG: preQ(1) synthase [Pseudanabaenales cyanobacterium]|nr:preQ(1) synthase [Pseudanabaenales cyanobacterium]
MQDKNLELKHLKKTTDYYYEHPDASVLETFPNPFADSDKNPNKVMGSVHIEAPEFTSLCPITGQPDFATIVIDYIPAARCIESKALKLYLGRFRQTPEFHESCVNRIANDLISVLSPNYLKVEGRFTPRGGIPFWPTAEYFGSSEVESKLAQRRCSRRIYG